MSSDKTHGSRRGRDLESLAARLDYGFRNIGVLKRAVTHRSAAPALGRGGHYERLEFLGDRVLGLVVAELLFRRFPDDAEGELARRHVALVRREALAEVAMEIGLGQYLRLAKGEQESGERNNPALLANACEAVIAALYLDGGLPAAERFVLKYWTGMAERESAPPRDNKTALQEWAQGRGLALPSYRELSRDGPAHDPTFEIEVSVEGEAPARGEGGSKRQAEQLAAGRLLARLLSAEKERGS